MGKLVPLNQGSGKLAQINKGFTLGEVVTKKTSSSLPQTERTARTAEASARRGVSASNTGGPPTTAQLRNQARQAAVDQDMDTLNRVNDELKRRRAALGKQTVGDRASDTASGMFNTYFAPIVNTVGTLGQTGSRIANQRQQIDQLQKALDEGGYRYGGKFSPLTDAGRRSIQDTMRRLADEAWKKEHDANSWADRTQAAADQIQATGEAQIASAKEGAGALGQLAVDVGVAGGQMGMDALTAALTGGSALVPMALRSFGGGAQEARRSGADLDDQFLYGAGSAALSVGTEKISNIAKPFKKMFGAGAAEKIAGSLARRFGESGAVQMMRRLSRSAAGRIALSAIGEGGEEVVEDVLQPFLKRATYDPGAKFNAGEAKNDFLVGAILGGLGGAVDVAGNSGGGDVRGRAKTGAGAGVQPPAAVDPFLEGFQDGDTEARTRRDAAKRPQPGKTPVLPQSGAAVQADSGGRLELEKAAGLTVPAGSAALRRGVPGVSTPGFPGAGPDLRALYIAALQSRIAPPGVPADWQVESELPGLYQEYVRRMYGEQPTLPLLPERSVLRMETAQGVQKSRSGYPLNTLEQAAQLSDGLKDSVASETDNVLLQDLLDGGAPQDGVSDAWMEQLQNRESLAILKKKINLGEVSTKISFQQQRNLQLTRGNTVFRG